MHIFEFVDSDVVRHGSARANVPLSSYSPTHENPVVDPFTVADHLIPAFRFAAKQIPPQYHSTTPVQYQATAGMRLLEEWQQQAVYDALYQGLKDHPDFVFSSTRRYDIRTLTGELEGYYGAVAANYLQGTCSANLTLIDDSDHPVGALDMGGSSTQIVFLPKPKSRDDIPETVECTKESDDNDGSMTCNVDLEVDFEDEDTRKSVLNDRNKFFSTSYLSYGVDQFRERVWTTLVDEHNKDFERHQKETNENLNDSTCDAKLIENPCAFPGYQIEWLGYTLIGTGDAAACMRCVQRLIPHPTLPASFNDAESPSVKNIVGGVTHPSVSGLRFVAMSLYFFTLDSLRELSGFKALNETWPNPSIQELVDALPALCQRNWHTDLFHIRHHSHKFTRAEVLPHRCLESVYLVTLLRDGFGFEPDSRSITFLFETDDGNEVEWTLGMALSIRAEIIKRASVMTKTETFQRKSQDQLETLDDLEMNQSDTSDANVDENEVNTLVRIQSQMKTQFHAILKTTDDWSSSVLSNNY